MTVAPMSSQSSHLVASEARPANMLMMYESLSHALFNEAHMKIGERRENRVG